MLTGKNVLITGGTGSFGNFFAEYILKHYKPKKIIIYSRDEFKQYNMAKRFRKYAKFMRFFIGDVRDKERLERAFKGVDYIIHAAAIKQITACEYNPIEAVKTNIDGAINVVNAALNSDSVKKVIALSTDKSVNPINLYGGTKLVSDKLFISANAYAGMGDISFSVVRYGNVAGSRGSVIPLFKELIAEGEQELPITDLRMTRFWISLQQGARLVIKALEESKGGEIFISKIPSFKVVDLAKTMFPECSLKEIGIREGEKLHEVMITKEDAPFTYEYDRHYIIYPNMNWQERKKEILLGGKPVESDFEYSSDKNTQWLYPEQLKEYLKDMEK